jgi:chromosomal replication initiation ATPase DnaA
MPQQIPFTLPVEPAMGEDDFLLTPSNAEAAALLKSANGSVLLLGPTGSGKSHLARIWTKPRFAQALDFHNATVDALEEASAWVWEDADKTAWSAALEQKAFHILNAVKERRLSLLLTATQAPASWPLQLADLRSRLLSLPVAQLHAPDDTLVAGLLVKHLKDRQIRVGEDVLTYLIPRLPREGAKIEDAVKRLDEAALSGKRAVTVPLVKEIFEF